MGGVNLTMRARHHCKSCTVHSDAASHTTACSDARSRPRSRATFRRGAVPRASAVPRGARVGYASHSMASVESALCGAMRASSCNLFSDSSGGTSLAASELRLVRLRLFVKCLFSVRDPLLLGSGVSLEMLHEVVRHQSVEPLCRSERLRHGASGRFGARRTASSSVARRGAVPAAIEGWRQNRAVTRRALVGTTAFQLPRFLKRTGRGLRCTGLVKSHSPAPEAAFLCGGECDVEGSDSESDSSASVESSGELPRDATCTGGGGQSEGEVARTLPLTGRRSARACHVGLWLHI